MNIKRRKKAVTGEDEVYDVVMEEDYGPTTGQRTLHKGLDRASARSAVRHYNKRAMPNQRFYEETEEDRLSRRPVRSSTRVTAAQRDSSAVVNKARDIYAALCDLYFDMTQGANAPFSEEGAPAYYLDKAISAIDDIYAFGLSEEDREAMSVDGATCVSGSDYFDEDECGIEGACGKKSVNSSYNPSARYKDVGGSFGDAGAVYTVQDLIDYWHAEYKYDPVLQEYSSLNQWLADTIGNFMIPVDGATCISGAATGSPAQQIYDFLDEEGGYTDYDQKIEDVMEAFGLSRELAESYVWDWSSGLNKLDDEEYETEGAASIEVDGELARDFGASLLQELVEARVDGISIYNVEIGRNLTTFYYEIDDVNNDYTTDEVNDMIEIAVAEIIGDAEEGQFD